MALSFDAASDDGGGKTGGSTVTWSHTVGASANLLLVGVAYSTLVTVSSVKYNGVSLGPPIVSTVGPSGQVAAIYALANPATGTNTMQVIYGGSGSTQAGAASFIGANNVSFHTTFNAGTGTSASATISSDTDQLVQDTVAVFATPTASGVTQEWNQTSGGTLHGAGSRMAGAASVTPSWIFSSASWVQVVAAILPSSTAGAGATNGVATVTGNGFVGITGVGSAVGTGTATATGSVITTGAGATTGIASTSAVGLVAPPPITSDSPTYAVGTSGGSTAIGASGSSSAAGLNGMASVSGANGRATVT